MNQKYLDIVEEWGKEKPCKHCDYYPCSHDLVALVSLTCQRTKGKAQASAIREKLITLHNNLSTAGNTNIAYEIQKIIDTIIINEDDKPETKQK